MKLVEILARELEVWPCEGYEGYAEQDHDREVRFMRCGTSRKDFFASILAEEDESYSCSDGIPYAGPVTRADWEAERARISKVPAMTEQQSRAISSAHREAYVAKANKDGWIRHRGGKCPDAAKDIKIDIKRRDGRLMENIDSTGYWKHEGDDLDVMYWRPHVATVKECLTVEQANQRAFDECVEKCASDDVMPAAKQDGPLQWRDRILELDAEQKAADEAHKAATEARDAERGELVAKLKAEGLALVQAEEVPSEDMSDWRNWKPGDKLEMIQDHLWSDMTNGKLYELLQPITGYVFLVEDEAGEVHRFDEDDMASSQSPHLDFKWHSRPSK